MCAYYFGAWIPPKNEVWVLEVSAHEIRTKYSVKNFFYNTTRMHFVPFSKVLWSRVTNTTEDWCPHILSAHGYPRKMKFELLEVSAHEISHQIFGKEFFSLQYYSTLLACILSFSRRKFFGPERHTSLILICRILYPEPSLCQPNNINSIKTIM